MRNRTARARGKYEKPMTEARFSQLLAEIRDGNDPHGRLAHDDPTGQRHTIDRLPEHSWLDDELDRVMAA
jgi:hypothetical protein